MDVAILPPQDLLKRHFKHHTNHHSRRLFSPTKPHHHHNNHPNSNTNTNTNSNAPRSNNRRRNSNSPLPSSGSTSKTQQRRSPSPDPAQPVMGQVRILKRGKEVKPVKQAPVTPPSPHMMGSVGPMRDAFGFYAGSACVTSPPPSELPLPAFFMKMAAAENNQKIASDLRRALNIC